jgi:hypothetical protein
MFKGNARVLQLAMFSCLLFCLSSPAAAQNPIDPSRRIDWSTAGVVGGIPPRTTLCATLNPGATTAQINSAISACPAGQTVFLNAGSYSLTASINLKNNVTLRGAGADQTLLTFTTAGTNCNGPWTAFCLAGSNSSPGGEEHHASWTSGYARSATSITLSNSLGITANSTVLNLDQRDENVDTGNIWNCLGDDGDCGGNSGGFARTDNECAGTWCSQQQQVLVTACAPSCNGAGPTTLTITPGLYMPNWRSSQQPGAWWASNTATGMGVENLSANLQPVGGESFALMMNCYGCWVAGVRSMWAGRDHIALYSCMHCTVRDSYFYQSLTHASVSYGVELAPSSSNDLIENNIFQQVTDSTPNNNGGGSGSVAAYNFAINDLFGADGWMQPSDYEHASGYSFWLREGNMSIGFESDNVHGTHHFTTLFRNYFRGWQEACNGVPCTAQTIPIHMYAASRYFNVVGNVLGRSGYHTNYQCLPSASDCPNGNGPRSIFVLGQTGNNGDSSSSINGFCLDPPTCTTHGNYDPLTANSLMRWGNYDVATGTARFTSSEVPSTLSPYGNPVPSSTALPASLYLSTKPSYFTFRGIPWPSVGPDVAGGNVAGVGGHVYMNPAQDCFLRTMGGPVDGSGSVLTFNAATCYGSSSNPAPSAPTNLRIVAP